MGAGFVVGDRGLGTSGDTHAAWMMAHAIAEPYLVVGASAIGQWHVTKQRPRDDAFIVRRAGDWIAAAVADGVGSRPHARYGASYTVESLTALLLRPFAQLSTARNLAASDTPPAPPDRAEETELKISVLKKGLGLSELVAGLVRWNKKLYDLGLQEFNDVRLQQCASTGWWIATPPNASPDLVENPNIVPIMQKAFENTHLGLRRHAEMLELELPELGCTGLALLLNVTTGQGVVGQVGDGAILGLLAGGQVRQLVEPPDTGDLQSTYTITSPNLRDYLAIQVVEPVAVNPYVAFYLMTDGLSNDLLYASDQSTLEGLLQNVDRNLHLAPSPAQAAAGMLNWLSTYQAKSSYDDRTLVVITQREKKNGDDNRNAGQSPTA